MSQDNTFRSKEQELERLTNEIASIKEAINEISAALGKIERHVKRSFGVPPKPNSVSNSRSKKKEPKSSRKEPTITPEEALNIFDGLASHWDGGNQSEVVNKLQEMIVPNLEILAHELGLTFKSKPSRKVLCAGIMGRLNERSMLSKNVNITSPQKEKMGGEKVLNDSIDSGG